MSVDALPGRSRFYWPFLWPPCLWCFITVRAATSFARLPYRPDFCALSLMCSYSRCSLLLTPRKCFFGVGTSGLKFQLLSVADWPRAAFGDGVKPDAPKTERSG